MRWLSFRVIFGLVGVMVVSGGLIQEVCARSIEVIPKSVRVEAGGQASQVLLQGAGADRISRFEVREGERESPYLLVKMGGKAEGRRTLILLARPDAPRDRVYGLSGDGAALPLKIRVVEPGEGTSIETGESSGEDLRETIQRAEGGRVVVSERAAPVVRQTIPSPLRVSPDGETKTLVLLGERLELIDDVRVREATAEPRYRGKRGKLPFRQREGGIEIDVVASRNTELGKEYAIDLMVDRFRAWTAIFVIGEPVAEEVNPLTERSGEGPIVIELPPEASLNQ